MVLIKEPKKDGGYGKIFREKDSRNFSVYARNHCPEGAMQKTHRMLQKWMYDWPYTIVGQIKNTTDNSPI